MDTNDFNNTNGVFAHSFSFVIRTIFGLVLLNLLASKCFSQTDSTKTSQDAIYNRPFITIGKSSTAVGGYLEGNTNYFSEDGVSEGFSMEMRRFNIFLYSNIHSRIKFLSELEFEHGTEEIALETALLDFELNPALNFRAGILLPPIGLVNANHDSPKWEFIERPLSSTGIIPTTLSEVGFGLHGKLYQDKTIFAYDAYIVNGLQGNVILNDEGKTYLASGKNPEMFGEDNNGTPMFNAKISLANKKIGEMGLSYYGGIYNSFNLEGNIVEEKRSLHLIAFDLSAHIKKIKIQGEYAHTAVQVPNDLKGLYGSEQYGAFLEFSYPVLKRKIMGFENSVINTNLRAERIDYNVGIMQQTNANIGDEVSAIALGIGFRPSASTIIRLNYRYHLIYNFLGNPPAHLGGFQFGVASYF
ncbi:MAG: hypothetical protein EPN85_07615 [Bacteroidetes bacterium]|nr:MAG: hypothetical protein EPN85_07615 [Bacteroidota bacterium]